MATTTRLQLTLLEAGQREKEAIINDGFTKIDTAIAGILDTKMLTDATVDYAPTYPPGTMYFNTSTNKLRVLRSSLVWANAA